MITGAVTGFTVTSWGANCTSDPAVTINGDGTGAVAFAAVATLSQEDPTWDSAKWGGYGNLWYPHVYMTNQWPGNPDGSGVNPMGRWDYASWFWPPFNGNPGQYTVRGELPCPTSFDSSMTCPGTPSALAPAPADRDRWIGAPGPGQHRLAHSGRFHGYPGGQRRCLSDADRRSKTVSLPHPEYCQRAHVQPLVVPGLRPGRNILRPSAQPALFPWLEPVSPPELKSGWFPR